MQSPHIKGRREFKETKVSHAFKCSSLFTGAPLRAGDD